MIPAAQLSPQTAGSASEPENRSQHGAFSLESAFALVLSGVTPQHNTERDIMRTLDLEADRAKSKPDQHPSAQVGSDQREAVNGSSEPGGTSGLAAWAGPLDAGAGTGQGSQGKSNAARQADHEHAQGRFPSRSDELASKPVQMNGQVPSPGAAHEQSGARQDGFPQGQSDRTGDSLHGNTHLASGQSALSGRGTDQLAALSQVTNSMLIVNKTASNTQGGSFGSAMVGISASSRQQSLLSSPQVRQAQTSQNGRSPSAEAALHAQLSRGLAQAMRSGEGTATIRLDPQHMGSLRVDVTVRNGLVEAVFRPSTVEAQRLLESDSSALEQALHTRGLRVDRIEVRPPHEYGVPTHAMQTPSHDAAMDGDRGESDHQGSQDPSSAHSGRGSGMHREQGDEQTGAGGTQTAGHGTELPGTASSAAESADELQTRAEPGGLWSSIDTIA